MAYPYFYYDPIVYANIRPHVFPPRHHRFLGIDFVDSGSNELRLRDHCATISFDDQGNNFVYKVDVSGFHPDELRVDIQGDDIKIQGEHKDYSEHEDVERSFSRTIRIPKSIHTESITCHLDRKGHLWIKGQKVGEEQPEKRTIPIQQNNTY